jgi:hypothetical protein
MANDMNLGPSVPRPDPTVLTTEALIREINHLRELTKAERRADVSEIEALARAHDKHHEGLDRLRQSEHQSVSSEISALKELLKEALASRDQALTAALAAAKEATGKAEDATTKQLDALRLNFDVEIKAIKDLLSDFKANASTAGGRSAGKEYVWGVVILIAALVLSFIGIIFTR